MAKISRSDVILQTMTFPVREVLQLLLGLCVGLAVLVLVRDLIDRGRRLHAQEKLRTRKESLNAPGLSDLESELE
jgi:hypothetical protein